VSLAARIKDKLGIDAAIEVGARGQFDVVVDGETIASRERGLLTRLFRGGGWPDEDEVVAALAERKKTRV
jgi:hypothetical protein